MNMLVLEIAIHVASHQSGNSHLGRARGGELLSCGMVQVPVMMTGSVIGA